MRDGDRSVPVRGSEIPGAAFAGSGVRAATPGHGEASAPSAARACSGTPRDTRRSASPPGRSTHRPGCARRAIGSCRKSATTTSCPKTACCGTTAAAREKSPDGLAPAPRPAGSVLLSAEADDQRVCRPPASPSVEHGERLRRYGHPRLGRRRRLQLHRHPGSQGEQRDVLAEHELSGTASSKDWPSVALAVAIDRPSPRSRTPGLPIFLGSLRRRNLSPRGGGGRTGREIPVVVVERA